MNGTASRVKTVHRFCISESEQSLLDGWYDDCVTLADYLPDSPLHVNQLDPFWHDAGQFAHLAAGAYALPVAIKNLPRSPELIELSHQGKRIYPSDQIQELSALEFTAAEAAKQPELAICEPRNRAGFLVGPRTYVDGGLIGHYATFHHCRDLLDYTSLAMEMDILNEASALEFLTATQLVLGGIEIGIFPRVWIVPKLQLLECVGREFISRHRGRLLKYDTYQVPAVGFLSERLGSFLLLRHLTERYSGDIPEETFGTAVLVRRDSDDS